MILSPPRSSSPASTARRKLPPAPSRCSTCPPRTASAPSTRAGSTCRSRTACTRLDPDRLGKCPRCRAPEQSESALILEDEVPLLRARHAAVVRTDAAEAQRVAGKAELDAKLGAARAKASRVAGAYSPEGAAKEAAASAETAVEGSMSTPARTPVPSFSTPLRTR